MDTVTTNQTETALTLSAFNEACDRIGSNHLQSTELLRDPALASSYTESALIHYEGTSDIGPFLAIVAEVVKANTTTDDIQPAVRELLCQRCLRDYTVWWTENELWNRVVRDGEHFFCQSCFAIIAEERSEPPLSWLILPCKKPEDGAIDLVDLVRALSREASDAKGEIERLKALVNTPHTADWMAAVPLEAAFQIERFQAADGGKEPADFFWLLGYLAGKALASHLSGDLEKAKHHTISTAAVTLNWHRRITGEETGFRPGIDASFLELVPSEPGPAADETDFFLRHTATFPGINVEDRPKHARFDPACGCLPDVDRDPENGWTTIIHKPEVPCS